MTNTVQQPISNCPAASSAAEFHQLSDVVAGLSLTKRCPVCGSTKSRKDFHKCKSRVDGLEALCSSCSNLKNSRWWKDHPEKLKAKKYRHSLRRSKHIMERNTRWKKEHLAEYRKYQREYQKKNRLHHPEKYTLLDKQISFRRRARLAKSSGYLYTTAQHILWRWEMWGGRCYVCGAVATATDHVKPLARGGSHYPSNLRPICLTCNSSKGAR